MAVSMSNIRINKRKPQSVVRSSISFPEPIYEEIKKIAESNKVSVAWVVREAVETYIEHQTHPLNGSP